MSIKDEHWIERQGKRMVPYSGLLDEAHQRARDRFMELERMDPALRSEVLANEDHAVYHTPCSAVMTAVVFRRLGVERDKWDIYWEKLYMRPIARVFNLYIAAQDVGPEHYNRLFTSFAKKVKPLKEAA